MVLLRIEVGQAGLPLSGKLTQTVFLFCNVPVAVPPPLLALSLQKYACTVY